MKASEAIMLIKQFVFMSARSVNLAVGLLAAAISILMLSSVVVGIAAGLPDPVTEIFRWWPQLRAIGYIEPYFPYVILCGALIGAIAGWSDHLFCPLDDYGVWADKVTNAILYVGLPLILGAVTLILASEKSGLAVLGNPNSASIGGYIPFNDAAGHWVCTLQQAITDHWHAWCNRRPLAAAMRATINFLGSYDHELAQLVQVAFISIGLYVAAVAIVVWSGPWSSLAFISFGLIGIRYFVATTLTGPIGFFIACLALAALVLSLLRQNILLNSVGVFLFTFALLVRMGAMFGIPALIVWSMWRFRENRRRMVMATGSALLAVTVVFGASHIVGKLYGSGNELGSNFAYVAAGLSLGGTWLRAESAYGKEIAGLNEKEAANFLYRKAIHNILQTPSVLFGELTKGEVYFWQNIWSDMFYGYGLTFPEKEAIGLSYLMLIAETVLLFGAILILKDRLAERDDLVFIGLLVASVAASVPFVIFQDGWRALLATTPFCSAFLAFCLMYSSSEAARTRVEAVQRTKLAVMAAVPVLLLTVIVGPWLFYWHGGSYRAILGQPRYGGSKGAGTGHADEMIIDTEFEHVGFVVVPDRGASLERAPTITELAFVRVLRSSHIDDIYHKILGQGVLPKPPFAFFLGTSAELASYGGNAHFFFGPQSLLEDRGIYRVSFSPMPNALKNKVTMFYRIGQATRLADR